jgi:predicted O-methyltransferase YrrM
MGSGFPDIGTAISGTEAAALLDLARGRRVIEIGAWLGYSAVLFSQAAEFVVSVDHHLGDEAHPMGHHVGGTGKETFTTFRKNVAAYAACPVIPIVALSPEALTPLQEHWFDMAFIDGNHNEEPVWDDAVACARLLEPGGLMVFHDYGLCEGVTTAVDRFRHDRELPSEMGPDSLARLWMRP